MKLKKILFTTLLVLILPGCTALPLGLGLIPGAPAYISSVLDNGPLAYETAVDERSTRQQMYDAVIAGHAQAELYKHKDIRALQITTYCYFGKLYLVGEYDSQEQLKSIYECADQVEGKRAIISRLYLKQEQSKTEYLEEQGTWAKLEAQLLADYEVTSSPLEVEVIQGNIILLGVISDKKERDRILGHANSVTDKGAVVSYLYHQEISGPEGHPMLAESPKPKLVKRSPPQSKPKKTNIIKKRPKRINPQEVDSNVVNQSMAANNPPPPLEVNGRILGL